MSKLTSPRLPTDSLRIMEIVGFISESAYNIDRDVKIDHIHTLTAKDINLEALASMRHFYAVAGWNRISRLLRDLENILDP